jgi:cytochrome P450
MFWFFYEILLHPKERAIIEQEIAPAFSPSPSDPNVETLSNLDVLLKAPLLNSMYWEALRSVSRFILPMHLFYSTLSNVVDRYSGGAVSTREVIEDTFVNGWKFERGGMVMIPLRPNHQDPKKYGDRVDEFVPDRFLGDFEKGDAKSNGPPGPSHKSLKPFGGGVSLCPGRHFAANQGLAFVATALRRFDFQLVEGQKEAKPLLSVPVIGTYSPDHDVYVRIRLKK